MIKCIISKLIQKFNWFIKGSVECKIFIKLMFFLKNTFFCNVQLFSWQYVLYELNMNILRAVLCYHDFMTTDHFKWYFLPCTYHCPYYYFSHLSFAYNQQLTPSDSVCINQKVFKSKSNWFRTYFLLEIKFN